MPGSFPEIRVHFMAVQSSSAFPMQRAGNWPPGPSYVYANAALSPRATNKSIPRDFNVVLFG